VSASPVAVEQRQLGPVKWVQEWLDVLFLHWSVPVAELRPHVPLPLEIDTREGLSWVSLVLFRLKTRPWWLPFYFPLANTTEVNFRTYVRCGDQPGIYFLSMHAHNRLAVWFARWLTPFPYRLGPVSYTRSGEDFLLAEGNDPAPLRIHPTGDAIETAVGSLEEWLTERYTAFAEQGPHVQPVYSRVGSGESIQPGNRIVEAPVRHPRWHLRTVEIVAAGSRTGPWWTLAPARPPDLLHFSTGVQAKFGPFRTVAP
jgi:uncharacterized protein YqjF (DUF2071 family)